jgi:type IV secretory pathway TraG/TraD family ATPase VirD4
VNNVKTKSFEFHSNNFSPLLRRAIKSSLGFYTNVKHFELRHLCYVHGDSIYLGRGHSGVAITRAERSALILGPSRSGKTSSLIVPNLLTTTRSVIATSTKDDVLRQLAGVRDDHTTLLFDPSGTIDVPAGVRRVGYSPLRAALEWDGAVLATRSLTDATRRVLGERGDDHWSERAGALVAPLLHVAALRRDSMGVLSSRVDRRDGDDSLELLRERYGDSHPATSLLAGVLRSADRELSGIWSSAAGLFSGLRTDAARQSAREAPLEIDKFLDGRHHLHIVAPSRHQAVSAPLIIGLIDQVVETTYARHRHGARLLLALDELANVAPLPRLGSVVSEGGGQGVLTLACLQDLSQARTRWGTAAEGFLSLFPTTLVLPGIADRTTLELLSALGGREMVRTPTIQRDRRGRLQGFSESWSERERLSVDQLAHGRSGYALALDDTKQTRWIQLTPAYSDPRFRNYLSRERSTSKERSRER